MRSILKDQWHTAFSYRGGHFPRWLPFGNNGPKMQGTKPTSNSFMLIYLVDYNYQSGEYDWIHFYQDKWHSGYFYCGSHIPIWPPSINIWQYANNKNKANVITDIRYNVCLAKEVSSHAISRD